MALSIPIPQATPEPDAPSLKSVQRADIAVIGMSGRFPGAASVDELWENLAAGRVASGPVPPGRWPDSEASRQVRGGFVDGIEQFDARFFRISAREAAMMDPQQRLFLEESWKAFEDAGLSMADLDGARCGVFAGCKAADYLLRVLHRNQGEQADGHLFGGNDVSMLPARVSYFFNLRGPSLPVNTACSSSMVALHLACQSLRNGDCTVALAGGVEFMTSPGLYHSMQASGALSADGVCRAFDDAADGMALAEAVCAVVLKPLENALADGDRIYGVVRAIGVNQDGRSAGINAPNGGAQTDLELQVWDRAGIHPDQIGYVEAHGTGTPLGDPTEFHALSDAFRKSTSARAICPIGSVKASIGHTLSAAGLSGLIRILLSLRHGQIPGMPHFATPNRHLHFADSPFVVNRETLPWPRRADQPRLAVISSFGFSGTNAHAVIAEAPVLPPPATTVGPELFLLSAPTESALQSRRADLAAWLTQHPDAAPRDIAWTLHKGRTHFKLRQALVATTVAELLAQLQAPPTPSAAKVPAGEPAALEARLSALLRKPGVDAATRRGALLVGAVLYERGHSLAWANFYQPGEQRLLSLPTYPFERERYWVDAPSATPAAPASSTVLLATPIWRPTPAVPAASVETIVLPPAPLEAAAANLLASAREHGRRPVLLLAAASEPAVAEALGAMARVLAIEYPKAAIRCVLAPAADLDRALAAEATAAGPAALVRYDGASRLVQEFTLQPPAPAPGLALPSRAVCLITGGAGGLGQTFAHHLARTRHARLLLCGRSAEDDRIRGLLASLRQEGAEADYVSCDVAHRAGVEQLAAFVDQRYGQSVDAVFHAAGVHRDALAANKSAADLDAELATKALAADHLRDVFGPQPLFVFFSSLAAVRGVPGQSGYAAANGYLDGLAEQLPRAVSIGWPLWANGGMRVDERDQRLIAESTGLRPMSDETGLAQFETILQAGLRRAIVLHGDGPALAQTLAPPPPPASAPAAAPTAVRQAALAVLTGVFSAVSHFPAHKIQPDITFEDYGLDSVMVKEFNVRLAERLPGLPRTLLFEVRTLGELADWLAIHHAHAFPVEAVASAPVPQPQPHRQPVAERPIATADIAIVGIHGRYPDAPDLDTFWRNLAAGHDAVTEIPLERWDWRAQYNPDPERSREGYSYCRHGAFVADADCFDERFFQISPREAAIMDPQERLFLETAWLTFESAGYTRARLRTEVADGAGQASVGVFVGVTSNTYQLFGPEQWGKGNPVMPVSAPWSIANRVSYWFGLTGPSMPVDSACSSSLVAVHMACESIRRGECRMALAGGVNLYLHPSKYVGMSQVRMLSPTGHCHAFGAEADGFVPGEGVGAILLRPLEEALAAGDPILGVLRGTAINHGGRTNSYTAPNPQSHRALICRALDQARVDPATIGVVEAHGTGTALGDPVEVRGLSLAFGQYTPRTGFCALSSVKSNIGHLEAAAGIAGLSKILLQFRHRQLAPTLHADLPNPDIDFAATPFVLQRTLADWTPPENLPRRAAISSFGAGGTNAHAVLEEFCAAAPSPASSEPQLIVLSARSAEALREAASRLARFLAQETAPPLDSIAVTLQAGRETMEHRFATVAASAADLQELLTQFAQGQPAQGRWWQGDRAADSAALGLLLDGPEGAAYLDSVRQHRRLDKLGKLWASGLDVDWLAWSPAPRPTMVALPGYPFERRRHWFTQKPEVTAGDLTVRQDDFFVRDHIITGAYTVPGIALVELARAAAARTGTVTALTQIVFLRRLAITQPVQHLRLQEADGAFTLQSADGTALMQGRLSRSAPGAAPAPLALDVIRARCSQRLTAAECYPSARPEDTRSAVVIGPALQSIRELYRGQDEVLARLELPPTAGPLNAHGLHPSLMDGALQCVVAMQRDPAGADSHLYFPFAIDGVHQFAPLSASMYAHMVPAGETRSGGEPVTRKFDVLLSDEAGKVAVAIRGFTTRVVPREVPREERRETAPAPVVLRVEWVPTPLVAAPMASRPARIVNPPAGFDGQLAAHGLPTTTDASGILWFVAPDADPFAQALDLLALRPERLLIIAPAGQATAEALSGLVQTARLERHPTTLQLLILAEPDAAAIAAEWFHAPHDPLVRYDGGQRCVRTLVEVAPSASATKGLKQHGVYLITGGHGALGHRLGAHLRDRWQAQVVLAGRSPGSSTDGLVYHHCDVTDATQVNALVASIRQRFGRLDGVIHAAGVLHEAFLPALASGPREAAAEVIAVKVNGAEVLHAATSDAPLDFFAVFSSVSGLLGGPGQAAYAYASAYLDAFAAHRLGVTVSFDWGIWREGRIGNVNPQVAEWLQRNLGVTPLDTDAALAAFEHGLTSGHRQLAILQGDRPRILQLGSAPPAISRPAPAPHRAGGLVEELAAMAAQLLQMDPKELQPGRNLSEYGFESVSLIEFTNAVNKRYGLELMPTVFFEYPTLEGLAAHLTTTFPTQTATMPEPPPEPEIVAPPAAPAIVTRPATDPIAIVGMSGTLPQSEDLDEFWNNLITGKEMVTEVPPDRWRWQDYFGDPKQDPNKTDSKWCGFMKQVDKFDPLFFGISPREAALMDPQQRLMLQHAWLAIEDAGHKPSDLAGSRTAVFVGVSTNDYATLVHNRLRQMEAHGPLGNALCIVPNRISYVLNLRGPSQPVDTGCSSAAVAIHRAVRAIQNDGCEMALAGGVNVILNPLMNVFFSQAGVMSKDHRCRAFDKNATGTIRGEGAGMILLKPLSRALADGNPIWGILRATGENHGGKSSSLTAPNPSAQADLIASVHEAAGFAPGSIGYIEAHGTGTALGDSVEIAGLKNAFARLDPGRAARPDAGPRIGIGSVKTNIGHLEPAAGIAAVFKVVQAMRHGVVPATRHFETVNPWLGLEQSPFMVVGENTPWPAPVDETGAVRPRRSGVSSFGMGGANAHLVIEEFPQALSRPVAAGSPQLFVFSARTDDSLRRALQKLAAWIENGAGGASAAETAWTLQAGREAFRERLAVVASDLTTVRHELTEYLASRPSRCLRGTEQRKAEPVRPGAGLAEVAAAWVQGAPVDWAALHPQRPRRVRLPGYQFAQIRCWINEDGTTDAEDLSQQPVKRSDVHHYSVNWTAEPIAETTGAGHTLLFTADAAWAEAWRAAGERVTVVPWADGFGSAADFLSLLQSFPADQLPSRAVFHLDAASLEPLFHFVHAWSGIGGLNRPRRILTTWHGDCGIREASAGFAKALAPILPNASFSAVQLENVATPNDATAVLAELRARRPDTDVRYRAGQRAVKRVHAAPPASAATPLLRREGVYLLAGGAGGLGLAVAKYLARTYRAKIVLLGRSPFDSAKRAILDDLNRLGGDGLYFQADITDAAAVRNAVAVIKARYGALHGVFHSAGFANNQSILKKYWADFEAVLAPRVDGVRALDEATASEPLDFFASFSSTSVFLGDMGQCDYAIANRYLDGYAELREKAGGAGKSIAINWPLWRDGGLHLDAGEEAALRYSGMQYLETADGMKALEAILAGDARQVMVLVTADPARMERFLAPAPVAEEEPPPAAVPPQAAPVAALALEEIEGVLRATISKLLDLAPERLDSGENLMNLGFDSILLNSFVQQMNERFPWLDLTAAALFEHPDIRSIATYFHSRQPSAAAPKAAPPRSLITLQSGGSAPPSFWVPGSFGLAQTFSALPSALGRDFPLYSFQARGVDGTQMPFTSVQEMAAQYAEAIRAVWSGGPLVLGGYSWGGLVAMELAKTFAEARPRVILFDTYPPSAHIYNMTQDAANQLRIRLILANFLAGHGEKGDAITERDFDGVPARLRDARIVQLICERSRLPVKEDEMFRLFRGALEVNDYASEAYTQYVLPSYAGPEVLYFEAQHGSDDYVGAFDYLLPWKEHLGDTLTVVPTDFSHAYLVSPAALQEQGSRMQDFIRGAGTDLRRDE
jgi:acyl transferase domain-containing protein/thioesterase domain-containing protein/aryl carrier-like protein